MQVYSPTITNLLKKTTVIFAILALFSPSQANDGKIQRILRKLLRVPYTHSEKEFPKNMRIVALVN